MGQSESKDEVPQAGGHGGITRNDDAPGTVMKVGRGTEIEFYKRTNSPDNKTIPAHIQEFFPKYYGLHEKLMRDYIRMEDLTYKMEHVCVMDIKMGTQTWTDDAFYLKKLQLQNKDNNTTSATMGFRITGMRVYRAQKKDFKVRDKDACMEFKEESDVETLLESFFFDGETFFMDTLKFYIKRLKVLRAWFEEQSSVSFYSSSILFVYDSNKENVKHDIRMIDFARVKLVEGNPEHRDTGYLQGIKSLLKILQSIRRRKSLSASSSSASPSPSRSPKAAHV